MILKGYINYVGNNDLKKMNLFDLLFNVMMYSWSVLPFYGYSIIYETILTIVVQGIRNIYNKSKTYKCA